MKVQVRLFALARQLAGGDTVELELSEPATVKDVKAALVRSYPALDGLRDRMLVAVNAQYADDATPVASDCEVACIPPVSGG